MDFLGVREPPGGSRFSDGRLSAAAGWGAGPGAFRFVSEGFAGIEMCRENQNDPAVTVSIRTANAAHSSFPLRGDSLVNPPVDWECASRNWLDCGKRFDCVWGGVEGKNDETPGAEGASTAWLAMGGANSVV